MKLNFLVCCANAPQVLFALVLIVSFQSVAVTESLFAESQGKRVFGDCYAAWDPGGELKVGNKVFERKWRLGDGKIVASSFLDKRSGGEWLVAPGDNGSAVAGGWKIEASVERINPVAEESLCVEVSSGQDSSVKLRLHVYPGVCGVLVEPTAPQPGLAAACTWCEGLQELSLNRRHVRLTKVRLQDRTDHHNELVFEDEWLLAPSDGKLALSANIVFVEDVARSEGLIGVKLAPLSHARHGTNDVDWMIESRSRTLTASADHYPTALLAYSGGRAGRIAELQELQRRIRTYRSDRDGQFLSNTWGDRSRDSRINERFIRQEIKAAHRLGVDVVQIDDGWQQGRSKNSSEVQSDRTKGKWNAFWEQSDFWDADRERFPNGLKPLVAEARERGIKLGLWYAPDSSGLAENWEKDAGRLLELHEQTGINYFKLDAIKANAPLTAARQFQLFQSVLEGSRGEVAFDLDVTAETRPGYFGAPHTGPIFVENRYTDRLNYWPHLTLRNLWKLSQYVDPLRLRMEFLNKDRNTRLYGDDPLAPNAYRADTLFAMVMIANPLGWFEVSNLPASYFEQMAPLVELWKREREALHGGVIYPVGGAPDGFTWTGFVSVSKDHGNGYALLFREANDDPYFSLDLSPFVADAHDLEDLQVLSGRGSAGLRGDSLRVSIPGQLDYLWVKFSKQPLVHPVARSAETTKTVELEHVTHGADEASGWRNLATKDWQGEAADWTWAGQVELDEKNARRLKFVRGRHAIVSTRAGAARLRNLISKNHYGDLELHLEFLLAKGSNAGVKLNGLYEIQLYDSHDKTELTGNDCGGIYPRAEKKPSYHRIDDGTPPNVNAAKPPGHWQTLDIIFRGPRFNAQGVKTENACFENVVLNGRLVHEDVEVEYPTGAAWDEKAEVARGPLYLQGDHGPVAYRNVRVREIAGKPNSQDSARRDASTWYREASTRTADTGGAYVLEPDEWGQMLKSPDGQDVFRYMTKKPVDSNLTANSVCCLYPVFSLGGEEVVDFAPGDHQHHRGVFLAWHSIEGEQPADFWGWGKFAPTTGRVIENRSIELVEADARHAVISVQNDWNVQDRVMLAEATTIATHDTDGVRVIDLYYRLTPQHDITLTQSAFGGFCVKGRKAGQAYYAGPDGRLDLPVPHHLKPETGWPAAAWYDYVSKPNGGGNRVGVAVVDHPRNPPCNWHNKLPIAMVNPCVVAPGAVALEGGTTLELRYRVVVHDGAESTELLNRLAADFRN